MPTDEVEVELGLGREGQRGLATVAEWLGWDPDELATAIVSGTMSRVAERVAYRLAAPAEAVGPESVEAGGNVIQFPRPRLHLPGP